MKSGAGDDPFGEPVANDQEDDGQTDSDTRPEHAAVADDGDDARGAVPVDDVSADGADAPEDGPGDDDGIPWVLRRRSVKDDRPNVTQFFLRDETDRAERRFRGEVEERLDTDVYLLDLREAAYVVAMQHPEEVASLLGRWGYDYRD